MGRAGPATVLCGTESPRGGSRRDGRTIEDLQNAVVVDRDGDKLGKVAQVYLDNDTRDPSWVTVKTGLLGTNESFVPLDKSDYADGTITVPFEKSYIKDAPPHRRGRRARP